MKHGLVLSPVTFVGKVYALQADADSNPDVYVCLDSKEKKGIVLRIFSKRDIGDAEAMASALNAWAGKE